MPSLLNPKYTFHTFVIGAANDLAASGASAVAAAPGRAYNPLFIYGETGLGKTHLMQAVAHAVLAHRPSARVLYLTAEEFRNDFVLAVQENQVAEFRARIESAELLLVDDVHVLGGRAEAQEEFARAFRVFHDLGRQVMLTSDRPPQALGVEEGLVRQFRWGRVADVGLPDFEHRLAILREKVARDHGGQPVPADVLRFIAEQVRTNVRVLEGALVRLVALSTLRGAALTMDTARAALVVDREAVQQTFGPAVIQDVVAREWGVTPEALIGKRRTRTVVEPRQVAMQLCRELLDLPLVQVGRAFGGRDHSTVLHALGKLGEELEQRAELRERVAKIRRSLHELRTGTTR